NEDKKPTAIPKKPSAGDDFNLGDAVVDGGNDDPPQPNPPKPKPNPNPNHPSSSDSFSDADLADGVSGGEGKGGSDGGGSHRKEGEEAEQGEVDMESHRNANAEPAVQRTLLEK
uniref:Uncharacterized protein n=1 Tax=Nomascus leucogenys TaxID=61853 RepID=A0A2I3HM39_NOMLE